MAEVPVHLSDSYGDIGVFAHQRFAKLAVLLIARGGQTLEQSMALPPVEEQGLGVILNGVAGTALYELDDMTDLTLTANHLTEIGDSGYQTSTVSAEIMSTTEPAKCVGIVEEFEAFEVGLQDGLPGTYHETGIIVQDKDGNEIADDISELVSFLGKLENLRQIQPDNTAISVLIQNVNRRLSLAMIEHDDRTPFTYQHYRKIMKVLRQTADPSGAH